MSIQFVYRPKSNPYVIIILLTLTFLNHLKKNIDVILIFKGELVIQKEGEEVDYIGALHRDGSVVMSVTLDQLKLQNLCSVCHLRILRSMPILDMLVVLPERLIFMLERYMQDAQVGIT